MMFEQLDNFFRSASETGGLIMIVTTCVLIIYLLFKLTHLIERIIQSTSKQNDQDVDVVIDNKEIHINVGQKTIEIHSKKLERLFCLLIGLGYILGIIYCLSNLIFIVGITVLVIVAVFSGPKKILDIFGSILKTGAKGVLRIASPK